jgi:hypothetical protein
MDCDESGHVTAWHDGSTHRDDAHPSGSQPGPACGVHTLNNLAVANFTAPATTAPYVAGTLDVDLGFLANSEFTIFVVERRWSDRTSATPSFLLGTQSPAESELASCDGNVWHRGLHLGYLWIGPPDVSAPTPAFVFDQSCEGVGYGQVAEIPGADGGAAGPADASVETMTFSSLSGFLVYRNGSLWLERTMATPYTGPLLSADGGSIGRALLQTTRDTRYVGDIAEIVAYSASLTTADRTAVEGYLQTKWGVVY